MKYNSASISSNIRTGSSPRPLPLSSLPTHLGILDFRQQLQFPLDKTFAKNLRGKSSDEESLTIYLESLFS